MFLARSPNELNKSFILSNRLLHAILSAKLVSQSKFGALPQTITCNFPFFTFTNRLCCPVNTGVPEEKVKGKKGKNKIQMTFSDSG